MTAEVDVALLRYLVLDDEHIPQVFAAIGFDRRIAVFQRGVLRWWAETDGPVWLMRRRQPEFCAYEPYVDGPGTPTAVFFDHGNGIGVAAACWIDLSQANRRFAPGA